MTGLELAEVARLVRDVAAAEIMPRFRRLLPGDVQAKTGPLDMVTVADEAAETALGAGLRARFPGCTIVGEEAASRDPAVMDAIGDAELCFVLDPIDGTANFCAGLPLFGTIVAVLRRGETVGAVIHDPVGDDTAWALRGEGAWLEAPGGARAQLSVAAPVPLAEMYGVASWRFMPEPMKSAFCARLPAVAGASEYRCAAHQYRMAAAGHCHFMVFSRLLPWDHAAGVLLHAEAGGYSALLDGSAYSAPVHAGGLICAPDRASWEALRDALFGRETDQVPNLS
ncbi:MAG TPA: inositol monophosphatase [Acetobacteraceae bacterium]|jgi:fructose-1,6-bisphosphatase/inositol monophosphatase family enzyme|nr:inositol monophosphatase [Acetobacteraceae bacterium]